MTRRTATKAAILLPFMAQVALAQIPPEWSPAPDPPPAGRPTESPEAPSPTPPTDGGEGTRSRTGVGAWVVSETVSPVDYSPQISATTPAIAFPGEPRIALSVHCRRGRTEAVLVVPEFARLPAGTSIPLEYLVISPEAIRNYSVERQWMRQRGVEQRWNELNRSTDIAVRGDAAAFLKGLPDGGRLFVRVRDAKGISHDAEFHLEGWAPIRGKLAAACRW